MTQDRWYQALLSRDARFDGVFFVGVTTTGIYCRPVCTARTAGRDRCVFFRHAAEAEREGFRACFRCRPELAPGQSSVDAAGRLASAATARLETSAAETSIEDVARELGVTSRHLRRVLAERVGVSPIELVQSKRLALAKQLLHDTRLPITDVAFASGFASVRRFNAVFRERFGRPPTAVRKTLGALGRAQTEGAVVLRLDYRPPLDWAAALGFLAARAIPGVESVVGDEYRRTVRIDGAIGWIAARPLPGRNALACRVSLSLVPSIGPLSARVRSLFDLDAHPRAIDEHLARDRRLAPLVRARPGLRLPGAIDGLEAAVRAILGQQVSVKAATTLAGRLAERFGAPIRTPFEELRLVFPSAARLAHAELDGLPQARARAVRALASSVAAKRLDLSAHAPWEATLERLGALPGIGPWTSAYVAMRALRWPDAFPGGDLAVRKALGTGSAAESERLAERWRPWRSYAVMHLWTTKGTDHVDHARESPRRVRARRDR
ncbi:MAG TPA: AlkA N-terminal domain-containing protein [Polyangiaceae bacterium]|nr:AlkA N-terminal domain-containing protein [Polyangiaceae bacterium]